MRHLPTALLILLIACVIGAPRAFCSITESGAAPKQGDCAALLLGTKKISFGSLVYHLAQTRDIHKLVQSLEEAYGGSDFQIPIPFSERNIFIFQEAAKIRSVLKHRSKLGAVNHYFNRSHGHAKSINAVDTTDELWRDLHDGLLDIFSNKKISPVMEKHKDILIGKSRYRANEALEEFFLKVWSEYSFGQVDVEEYARVRAQLLDVLKKVFHGNRLNRVPIVGDVTSRFNRWRYSKELKMVDNGLEKLLKSAIDRKEGAFYELYERLLDKYPQDAFQIALDNSFLGVLVYDFIYIVMLDATANIAKTPELDRRKAVQQGTHNAFLFPFRFRETSETYDGVNEGDFCVINLQKAGLYFSAGDRTCSGVKLFREISEKFRDILDGHELKLADPSQEIRYDGNKDFPGMITQHEILVQPRCPFARMFAKDGKAAPKCD